MEIYDVARSVGGTADIAFDPRVLGLHGRVVSVDRTTHDLLWLERCDDISVVGREDVRAVSTWHVRAKRSGVTLDWWIEEPSFRVHRLVGSDEGGVWLKADSKYATSDPALPYPSRVRVADWQAGKEKGLNITVASFEVGKPIEPDRFTPKSLNLPLNTMFNDYRISRIIGYWDGEKAVPHPVQRRAGPVPARPLTKQSSIRMRFVLLAVNVGVLLLLSAVLWRRRRSRGSASVAAPDAEPGAATDGVAGRPNKSYRTLYRCESVRISSASPSTP